MEIWSILLTAAISFLFTMLAFKLQQKSTENKQLKEEREAAKTKQDKALANGLVCVLRKHLIDEHEMWTEKGYITEKALDSGLLMYKAYKDLGGNGMIDHMKVEVEELPIKK